MTSSPLFRTQADGAFVADPINATTGNFTLPETDVAFPGKGLGLSFARTYNAQRSTVDGPLGFGWTHNYDEKLTTYAAGEALIVDGSGRNDLYTPKAGGGFDPPPGGFDTLVANVDGTFTLTDTGLTKKTFSAAGALTAITDRNNNMLTLGYTAGKLTTVTRPRLTHAHLRLQRFQNLIGHRSAQQMCCRICQRPDLPNRRRLCRGGAFAGERRGGVGYPGKKGSVSGISAGAGLTGFYTNANSVTELKGSFTTYNFNIGLGPVQLSLQAAISGKTMVFAAGIPGMGTTGGASVSTYKTTTKILFDSLKSRIFR